MKKFLIPILLISCFSGCALSEKNASDAPTAEPSSPAPTITATAVVTAAPTAVPKRNYEAMDAVGTGWGFVRQKGKAPELLEKQIQTLENNGGIYMDHSGEKRLYLTFDEGYENGYSAKILDTLAEKNVKAAFFVTGPYLEGQGELIRRMIDDGHIIGNHTVHHLNLPKQTVSTVTDELEVLNKTSEDLYGYSMRYMRPPEGEYSERVLAIAEDLGYTTVMWSMAYKDWDVNTQKGADYAYEQVVDYLHPGAVILLHAVSADNAAALSDIIDEARKEGYEFYSLDDWI